MSPRRKKKSVITWKLQIMMIAILLASLAAMPTTIMLFFGMLPTAAALFIDRTENKTRVLSVGAMNMAGCSPFVLQLWTTQHSIENAFVITTDPRTIIVMYCAAGVGYLIDWTIAGLVGSMMVSKASMRREQIRKRKDDLIERWGREVSGEIPVDAMGFPLDAEQDPARAAQKP